MVGEALTLSDLHLQIQVEPEELLIHYLTTRGYVSFPMSTSLTQTGHIIHL